MLTTQVKAKITGHGTTSVFEYCFLRIIKNGWIHLWSTTI